jgi:tetratricopeptide (TPR) repeat protein
VRVLLLGRLALALYLAPAERQAAARVTRDTVSAEAVAIARRLGDDGVLAHALYARCFATWGRDNLPERVALTDELLRVAGDGELMLAARHWQIVNGLETGDVTAVDRHLQAYVRTAAPLGQPFYEYWTCVLRATRALMRARFDEAEKLCLRALDLGRQLGSTDTGFANGAAAQFQAVRYEQGRTAELEPMVAAFVEQIPDRLAWRMALAQIYTAMGRLDDARHHFEILARNDFRDVPDDPFWLTAIAGLADVSAILGDVPRARLLYHLLEPYRGRFVVVSFGFACFAAVDHHLGVLAHTVGWWERADAHLRVAFEAHRRTGLLPALARTARRRAALAAHRGAPDAGPVAAEAEKLADEAGMSWLHTQPRTAW